MGRISILEIRGFLKAALFSRGPSPVKFFQVNESKKILSLFFLPFLVLYIVNLYKSTLLHLKITTALNKNEARLAPAQPRVYGAKADIASFFT